jgi:hypothetical protein
VERQLDSVAEGSRSALQELIGRTKRILSQRQKDKNKLYALHAPEVECLAKGKARTPYEFGVKVSITTTHKEGLVVGARSMPGNPYDGHTLAEALEQAAILSDAVQGLKTYGVEKSQDFGVHAAWVFPKRETTAVWNAYPMAIQQQLLQVIRNLEEIGEIALSVDDQRGNLKRFELLRDRRQRLPEPRIEPRAAAEPR